MFSRKMTVTTLAVLVLGVGVISQAAFLKSREWKSGIPWTEPAKVDPGNASMPPSDAIVLFDGSNMDQWENGADWIVKDGAVTANKSKITSKKKFRDCQLHIEFATPAVVEGEGQGRGNSGLFFMGLYEVQILDSFNNTTYYDGQCGSLYKQAPPLVNACRKPGEWQTYDIIFKAPRFNRNGSVKTPGYFTVIHNGVVIQNHTEILGATAFIHAPVYTKHEDRLPLAIQYHRDEVRFRNIWVRELPESAAIDKK